MKTAKKTLALVLAAVMAFGMFGGIGFAGALDYTDADQITYVEAVELMTSLGVFEGLTTGNFNPKGSLQRDAAVKIVAYVALGPTVAEGLRASNTGFSDVGLSHWASAYIAWAVENKIAVGMGDGTFKPTANVTNLQFAKMLLVALGWGKNKEYEGENWGIRVSQKAAELGIFDGNSGGANHNTATREEACLYAYNLLKNRTPIVVYNAFMNQYYADNGLGGGGVPYGNFADYRHFNSARINGEISFDIAEGEFIFKSTSGNVKGVDTEGYIIDVSYTSELEFPVDASPEDYGRSVTIWASTILTSNGQVINVIKAEAASGFVHNDSVIKRFGKGTSRVDNLWTKSKSDFVSELDAGAVPLFFNGTKSANIRSQASDSTADGNVVIALDNLPADGKADKYVVLQKFFGVLGADPVVNTTAKTVNINGINSAAPLSSVTSTKQIIGYEGLKKGDGVLITVMNFNAAYAKLNTWTFSDPNIFVFLEKAESVTGQLTSRTTGNNLSDVTSIVFGGKSYNVSGINFDTVTTAPGYEITNTAPAANKDATIWLDNFGNVVGGKGAAADAEYYILMASGATAGYGTTYFQGYNMAGEKNEYIATTGSSSAIKHLAAIGTNVDDQTTFTAITENSGDSTTVAPTGATVIVDLANDTSPKLAGYNGTTANKLPIGPTFYSASRTADPYSLVADNNTVFYYMKADGTKMDRFVGYLNIPALNENSSWASTVSGIEAVRGSNNVCKYVLVIYNDSASISQRGTDDNTIYVLNKDKYTEYPGVGGASTYYTMNVIVGGEYKSVELSAAGLADVRSNVSSTTYGYVKVAYANGRIVSANAEASYDGTSTLTGVTAALTATKPYSNGNVTLSGSIYAISSAARVWYIEAGKDPVLKTVNDIVDDGTDTAVAVFKDNVIQTLFITVNP